ncbi:protein kinase superfamily protein [Striga asiatica]|uniref:Protein kinase superfamily protein n=1 Tax=Striga asiatica TaxID=4170 RepID=A0A5A7Q074_STRAF|nr:protein kinase superfamily protein [Striga asiatica]
MYEPTRKTSSFPKPSRFSTSDCRTTVTGDSSGSFIALLFFKRRANSSSTTDFPLRTSVVDDCGSISAAENYTTQPFESHCHTNSSWSQEQTFEISPTNFLSSSLDTTRESGGSLTIPTVFSPEIVARDKERVLEQLGNPPPLVAVPRQAFLHEIKKPRIGHGPVNYLVGWVRYDLELGPKGLVLGEWGPPVDHLVEDAA